MDLTPLPATTPESRKARAMLYDALEEAAGKPGAEVWKDELAKGESQAAVLNKLNPPGANQHMGGPSERSSSRKKYGETRAYILRRLARDRPRTGRDRQRSEIHGKARRNDPNEGHPRAPARVPESPPPSGRLMGHRGDTSNSFRAGTGNDDPHETIGNIGVSGWRTHQELNLKPSDP